MGVEPHLHKHDFDEAFYMLEGELVLEVEDELFTKRKGALALAPRNVPHALDSIACCLGRHVAPVRTCSSPEPRGMMK